MELHLDTKSFVITDRKGRVVSLADARQAYYAVPRKLKRYNLAFVRLADNGFNLAKTRAEYEAMDKAE